MEERQPKRAKFTEASSSSTSLIGNNYYVFLSFRGLDTRNGFVDHLYHKLVDVGLPFHPNFVFRDDEKLPFGEDIATNLIGAIEQSKVSIPVISENYATSEWCLRELIHIMKCQKKGQKVLTVFYKVKPSEVREVRTSEGAFGNAFRSSMHLFKDDVKEEGPEALREAAASRIFESDKFASGHEGELVKELVRVIMDEQQHDFLPSLPGNLVGIDGRVAQVMKLADTNPSETRIIGICGIGGIGKTTLATNIYNKLSKKFECRSFLRDIRETINLKGMEHIQSLLISDITKNLPGGVRDSVRGIRGIQLSCENKNVLIFLDDVGHRDHIDKLIGGCKFKPGSRIIITCRDKALLKSEYERYELEHMNFKDSMLLFSLYAFGAKQPPTKLANLSSDIVATTGGLPLALEITGSLLKGKPENIWIETLVKLKKVPNKDVQKVLRITYDSLEHEEQQMFLDIACLFTGIHKRIAIYLWKDLQLHPDSGLARMIDLSLIKYDVNNELRMHDQLRDLGRAIASPANKKPWECSRLWGEEAITVQRSKEENRNIEALRLDENGSNMFMNRKSFKRMPYLKFLRLSKVDFVGDFEDSLSELRWLEWEKCLDSFEAINVHLEKLLILDLSDGNISENWGGWRSIKMERLKVLNLSRCAKLSSLPHTISKLGELEELDASECKSLGGEVPINGLSSLKILRLGKISDDIDDFINYMYHKPPSLKVFIDLSSRQHLDLTNCDLPVTLTVLEVTCHNRTLPELSPLIHLEELNLQFCEYLESIPVLPSGILRLWVFWCDKLKALPNLSSLEHLSELRIVGCGELEEIEGLEGLKSLGHLYICGCMKLSNLKGLEQLESLRDLEMMELDAPLMNDLFQVQSLGRFKNLALMLIDYCQSLERPDISQLTNLQVLWFGDCKNIVEIKGLERLKKLRSLNIVWCHSITRLSLLNNLEELYINDCPNLHEVEVEGPEKVISVTWLDAGGGGCGQYREKSDELSEVRESRRLNSKRS